MAILASIDLGTNTFHILVVKSNNERFEEIYRERIFVNLAEDGIQFISDSAKSRVFDAIQKFKVILEEFEVDEYFAVGTAGLRIASNGLAIIDEVFKKFNFKINLISGIEEAKLIFLGAKQSFSFDSDSYLIMDIGGGSVEFILVSNGKIVWSDSFSIGVAILYNQFHKRDPIHKEEIILINNFLEHKLNKLNKNIQNYEVKYLIGASGTFDLLDALIEDKTILEDCLLIEGCKSFYELYEKLVAKTFDERKNYKDIPVSRIQLLPVAFVLIKYILTKVNPKGILISPYAMKEGIIYDMINN